MRGNIEFLKLIIVFKKIGIFIWLICYLVLVCIYVFFSRVCIDLENIGEDCGIVLIWISLFLIVLRIFLGLNKDCL